MDYTTTFTDSCGHIETASINDCLSREAISNDYYELIKTYNPKYVNIRRLKAQPGEEMRLKITVNAPSHYLESPEDISPKPCQSMTVFIAIYNGYPLKGVKAQYMSNHYLASPNVFRSGAACIDHWIPFSSSLPKTVDKLINDIIHNVNVTRYDSMANSSMCDWHKNGVKEGLFPTIHPKLLYAAALPPLPEKRNNTKPMLNPPPLPKKDNKGK